MVPRHMVGCSRAGEATAPWSPGTALPWKGPCSHAASTARGHMNQHVSAGHVAVICGCPGRAAGSQLTLTHRLGTRRLVRCRAAQVAATCSGRSCCGVQGPRPCADTCGSPPAWLPATVRGQAQGAGAAPEWQLPLSTLVLWGREWRDVFWPVQQEGKCQPSRGPVSCPHQKVLGWEQRGYAGATCQPGTDELATFHLAQPGEGI